MKKNITFGNHIGFIRLNQDDWILRYVQHIVLLYKSGSKIAYSEKELTYLTIFN